MQIERPPAHLKGNPTLGTIHAVETVLRDAYQARQPPLSFAEIERRLPQKRVRFETIKAAVLELARHRLVTVGSDGVMWIVPDRPTRVRHEPLE